MKEMLPKAVNFQSGTIYKYIIFQERTVKENVISVKRDTFFSATCEGSLNIVDNDCGKEPTLLCYIGNEYIIVNISGDPMPNCTGTII
jgi:hypothetical protein